MKKNIALVFGGMSGEHDVSISSASEVAKVIDREKYTVVCVAIRTNGYWVMGDDAERYLHDRNDSLLGERNDIAKFVSMVQSDAIDLVIPITHGSYGEDGRLQGFLDIIGVKYAFSGHRSHALGIDKQKAKVTAAAANVPIIPGSVMNNCEVVDVDKITKMLKFPVFVKPNSGGSSLGITMVSRVEELLDAVAKAHEYSDHVVIEKMIAGRELTVGVMGDEFVCKALPVVEIIPQTSFWYDYDAKYSADGSDHICPADIPESVVEDLKRYAEKVFVVFGCRDIARVDFLWDEKSNHVYFLEINTIPGMTATSLLPDAANVAGIDFTKLVNEHLIEKNLQ